MTRNPSVHPAAAYGYARASDTYASGRPDYPAGLGDWLAGPMQLGAGAQVLDLGAGTGKFCPHLLRTGATVLAVEPVAEMRARLMRDYPDVQALSGTASAIPAADNSLDAVVCVQAFHWFAGCPALDEIARVLKPGGRLGLVWNVRDNRVAWVAALTALMAPFETGVPRYHTMDWQLAFPHTAFGPLSQSEFPHVHHGPAQHVIIDRLMSVSFIANLPAQARQGFHASLLALISETFGGGPSLTVAFPYTTAAFHSVRI